MSTGDFLPEGQRTSVDEDVMEKNRLYESHGSEFSQNYYYKDGDEEEELEAIQEEILRLQAEIEALRRASALLRTTLSQMERNIENMRVKLLPKPPTRTEQLRSHPYRTEGRKRKQRSQSSPYYETPEKSIKETDDSKLLTQLVDSTKDLAQHRSYYQTNYPTKYVQDIQQYLLIKKQFDPIEYLSKIQRLRSALFRSEPLEKDGKVKLPLPRADKLAGYLYPIGIIEPLETSVIKMQDLDGKEPKDVTKILLPYIDAIKFAELTLQSNSDAISKTGLQSIVNKINEILHWSSSTRSLLEEAKNEILRLAKKYGSGLDH